jgi:hypothetical protein
LEGDIVVNMLKKTYTLHWTFTCFCWGSASSATTGIGEFLGAAENRARMAAVWLTEVVVVVIAVHTVPLLVLSGCAVASEIVEFILPVLHQKCRHFAGQIGLKNSEKMRRQINKGTYSSFTRSPNPGRCSQGFKTGLLQINLRNRY